MIIKETLQLFNSHSTIAKFGENHGTQLDWALSLTLLVVGILGITGVWPMQGHVAWSLFSVGLSFTILMSVYSIRAYAHHSHKHVG